MRLSSNRAEEPRQWTRLFARSSFGSGIFYMKGSRRLNGYESDADWDRIRQMARALGVPNKAMSWGNPGSDITTFEHDFVFLDGGFVTRSGNEFGGLKGSWVIGRRSFRLVCHWLEIPQPRKWRGERAIPTRAELEAEIAWQLQEERGLLDARLMTYGEGVFGVWPREAPEGLRSSCTV